MEGHNLNELSKSKSQNFSMTFNSTALLSDATILRIRPTGTPTDLLRTDIHIKL